VRAMLEERSDLVDEIRWTPRLRQFADQSIDHQLEINDAIIALIRGTDRTGAAKVLNWFDDDLLSKRTRFKGFIPDGFCLVQVVTGSEDDPDVRIFPLFLEIDRGTETIKSGGKGGRDWYSKIRRYGNYFAIEYPRDPFYLTLGFTPEEVNLFEAPRVLTITTNPNRVEKMIATTHKAQGSSAYWYASREDVHDTPNAIMGEVWRNPMLAYPHKKRLDVHLLGLPEIGPDYSLF